jgi:protein gp37
MSAQTKIEWCDSTFNPWVGCTRVSPACDDCYAARSTPARTGKVKWGAGEQRRRTASANWRNPKVWNERKFWQCLDCGWRGEFTINDLDGCPGCGKNNHAAARRRVFCASLADWLDNEVQIEWLVDLLDLIRRTPNLDWLLLTKRIGNWQSRITRASNEAFLQAGEDRQELYEWLSRWLDGDAPPNVWIGSTVIDQDEADRDVPKLLRVPATIRFLSIEPMLGPVDLIRLDEKIYAGKLNALLGTFHWSGGPVTREISRLDWIIAGGESGPHARPMHPDWVRSLRDRCAAAGVAFHFKQWGEWLPFYDRDIEDPDWRNIPKLDNQMGRGATRWINLAGGLGFHGDRLIAMRNVGKAEAGRLLDGVEHNAFPVVSHG